MVSVSLIFSSASLPNQHVANDCDTPPFHSGLIPARDIRACYGDWWRNSSAFREAMHLPV